MPTDPPRPTPATWRSRLRETWPGRPARLPPPPSGTVAAPLGFDGVRFVADDRDLTRFLNDRPDLTPTPGGPPPKVLALSGGGAGGAFGAGALVGLSQSGQRPVFDTVTGVSTGALIAPFAFVGSDWDARLEAAFTDGYAAQVFALSAARPWGSFYPDHALRALVTRYVDAELVAGVAQRHAEGGRLFVATANLDAQTTSIWDIGAIAQMGGQAALDLVTNILVASSSLPGVFPPQLIDVSADGHAYQELHIDGGAITPMFVVPETLIWRRPADWTGVGVEVYALVNTTLAPGGGRTAMHAVPILMRSFELMLRSSYRAALRTVAAFCQLNGFALHVGNLPPNVVGGSLLRFDQTTMRQLFDHGAKAGAEGALWRDPWA